MPRCLLSYRAPPFLLSPFLFACRSWRWLEVKLTELGMLHNPAYRICFVLDKTSMFSVVSTKPDGTEFKHKVKPLQIIWSRSPQHSARNTLHIDDLSRNFALNPGSGLKVHAYHRDRQTSPDADTELLLLAAYLRSVASAPDLSSIDHSSWRSRARKL